MEARAISNDSVSKLVPGASHSLAHLSDSELLTNTRHLAGKSNQVFAALLQRQRGCGTLRTDDAKPPRPALEAPRIKMINFDQLRAAIETRA